MKMSLLLGAPDCRVKENDVTTWETNKIGGSPVSLLLHKDFIEELKCMN